MFTIIYTPLTPVCPDLIGIKTDLPALPAGRQGRRAAGRLEGYILKQTSVFLVYPVVIDYRTQYSLFQQMNQKKLYQSYINSLYDSLQAKRLADYFFIDAHNPQDVVNSKNFNDIAESIRNRYLGFSDKIVPVSSAIVGLKDNLNLKLENFEKIVYPIKAKGIIPYRPEFVWSALKETQKAKTYADFQTQRQLLERLTMQTEDDISPDEITALAINLRIGFHSSDQKSKASDKDLGNIDTLRSTLHADIQRRLKELRAKRPIRDTKRKDWLREVEGARNAFRGRFDLILGLYDKVYSPLYLGKESREGIAGYLLQEDQRRSAIEGSRNRRERF